MSKEQFLPTEFKTGVPRSLSDGLLTVHSLAYVLEEEMPKVETWLDIDRGEIVECLAKRRRITVPQVLSDFENAQVYLGNLYGVGLALSDQSREHINGQEVGFSSITSLRRVGELEFIRGREREKGVCEPGDSEVITALSQRWDSTISETTADIAHVQKLLSDLTLGTVARLQLEKIVERKLREYGIDNMNAA